MAIHQDSIQTVDGHRVSYGIQSPSADTLTRNWSVNDIRVNIDNTSNILMWRCSVAGKPGTWVVVTAGAGSPGIDGTNGINAFTTTTANFSQPTVGGSVTIAVAQTGWMVVGEVIFIAGGGYYTVQTISTSTSVQIINLGYPGNAAPATTIASTAKVSPGGLKGVDVTPTSVGNNTYIGNSSGSSAIPSAITLPTVGQVAFGDGSKLIGSPNLLFTDSNSAKGFVNGRRSQGATLTSATVVSGELILGDGNSHFFQGSTTISAIRATNWNSGALIVVKLIASGGTLSIQNGVGILTRTGNQINIPSGTSYTMFLLWDNTFDGAWTEIGGLTSPYSLTFGGVQASIGTVMPRYLGVGDLSNSASTSYGLPSPAASWNQDWGIYIFNNSLTGTGNLSVNLWINAVFKQNIATFALGSGAIGNFPTSTFIAPGQTITVELAGTGITGGQITIYVTGRFS